MHTGTLTAKSILQKSVDDVVSRVFRADSLATFPAILGSSSLCTLHEKYVQKIIDRQCPLKIVPIS